ncbi:glycosyltransferase family A protein [Paracoccus sp. PAR01]|uniref:glycosyltransferase family A protein n=1 Tax=Paracoccus sp. PAR01 TaxID=2769282 RepID=UPI00178259BF|nr:glycosyltransferase family A protein [Paracoccus sp. PAR01]MBD9528136.1 glycosyltransferase family 2 protein [Paracoccus sp. PAR01]
MNRPTIITLSTIPPRFGLLGPTLDSLLRQKLPAQQILLQIPKSYRRFTDWDGRLPDVPTGVTISRCEADLGPATKILPACREFAGQDVDLLFCDDDKIYDRDWHARLKKARAEHPDACIVEAGDSLPDIADSARPADRLPRAARWSKKPLSYRIKRVLSLFTIKSPIYASSGFVDVLGGHGGVMVKPDWFGPEAWDIPPVLWTVDDPWLSGHLERQGIPIWLLAKVSRMRVSRAGGVDALHDLVEMDHGRVEADIAAIDYMRRHYGIWQPGGTPIPPASWMSNTMRRISRRALEAGDKQG